MKSNNPDYLKHVCFPKRNQIEIDTIKIYIYIFIALYLNITHSNITFLINMEFILLKL